MKSVSLLIDVAMQPDSISESDISSSEFNCNSFLLWASEFLKNLTRWGINYVSVELVLFSKYSNIIIYSEAYHNSVADFLTPG
jgi:hypothetical protein